MPRVSEMKRVSSQLGPSCLDDGMGDAKRQPHSPAGAAIMYYWPRRPIGILTTPLPRAY